MGMDNASQSCKAASDHQAAQHNLHAQQTYQFQPQSKCSTHCASGRHSRLHLFPPLLPLLLCDLEEVAHESCVALGIGQLV